MEATKKHSGGCHCGEVRYEAEIDLTQAVFSCNCSICSKKGTLLSFVPIEQFRLVRGENELSDYQFNKHIIHHLFCKTCGVGSFSRGLGPDGKEMCAINVRCLDNVDLETLKVRQFDGRNL